MFDQFYVLYFDVLLLGAIVSYFPYKTGDRKFVFILILFVATLAFELLTLALRNNKVKGGSLFMIYLIQLNTRYLGFII